MAQWHSDTVISESGPRIESGDSFEIGVSACQRDTEKVFARDFTRVGTKNWDEIWCEGLAVKGG